MPEQLAFPSLDPAPTDRLFFAIFPDAPAARCTAETAGRLSDQHGLTGRPLAPRRFHVSLHCLGDYAGVPNDIVAKAREAAANLAATPFGLMFDLAGSFAGQRRKLPLVLRSGDSPLPLIAFQRALGEAMARNGLGRFVSPLYTPHMTLLYDARYVEPRPVEPVGWTVREFVLVRSLLGLTMHIPLARFRLRGAAVEPAPQ